MQNRILWLDYAKGIGIILIMLSHFISIPHYFNDGYIGLFFIIAGLNYKNTGTPCKVIKKKAERLLIPYFVYSFVAICAVFLFDCINGDYSDIVDSCIGVIYSRVSIIYPYSPDKGSIMSLNAPLWFLTCLFMCIAIQLLSERYNRNIYITIVLLFVVSSLKFRILLPWSIDGAAYAFLFFTAAYKYKNLLFKFICNINYANTRLKLILPVLIILYVYGSHCNGTTNWSIRNYGALGVASIFLLYILNWLYFFIVSILCHSFQFINTSILSMLLSYIGRSSLRLLCIHLIVKYVVDFTVMIMFNHNLDCSAIGAFIYIFATVSISYFIDALANIYNLRLFKYL